MRSRSDQNYGRDCLGLVLLQLGSFFDDCISITISAAFVNKPSVQRFVGYTVKYRSEFNKGCPQLVTISKQRLKLIVAVAIIRINTVCKFMPVMGYGLCGVWVTN